jgi:hypothetical protein
MVLATDKPLTHFQRGNHTHIAMAIFYDIVFPFLCPRVSAHAKNFLACRDN